jgi:hypothetical protein
MRYRVATLAVFPWLAVVILNVGAASAGQVSKAAPGASPAIWVTPRLPDGHPDLQGVWDFRTATPLERPLEFAQQEFLTDENVVAVERRAAERLQVQRPDEQLLNTAPWWLDFGTHVVSTGRSSLIVDPADGRVPPMTPAGLKRQTDLVTSRASAEGPEGLTSWDRCITRGLPEAMLPTAYNNNLQLVQTPGYVVITTEMIHEARIVPVDGRSQLPQDLRGWNGSSRGRWEGDTLVVETSNFSDKSNFRGASGNLHLIERFSRIDASTIDYRFTVEDPSTWTAAWTVAVPLVKTTDLIYEYACHEANYSLENMLRIARADETAQARRPQ